MDKADFYQEYLSLKRIKTWGKPAKNDINLDIKYLSNEDILSTFITLSSYIIDLEKRIDTLESTILINSE